jgi:biotin operon repressor
MNFDSPKFSAAESAVLQRLRKGRTNAVSMPTLAAALAISTRDLQHLVKHLREEHGILITSSCGKNPGYYYPQTQEEHAAGIRQIEHRIISLARLLKSQNKAAYERIFGQVNFLQHGGKT